MFPIGFRGSIRVSRPLTDSQLGDALRVASRELIRVTAENVRVEGASIRFTGGVTRQRALPYELAVILVRRGVVELVPGTQAAINYTCSTVEMAFMLIGASAFAAIALHLIEGGLSGPAPLFAFGLPLATLCMCWLIASAAFEGLAARLLDLAVQSGSASGGHLGTPLT